MTVPQGDTATELDLTNSHLRSLESVPLPSSLTLVDLTANRLTSLDPRLLELTGLRSLNFRQNLLSDASPLNSCSCKSALQDLELRDNQLTQIPELTGFEALERLELSYNEIRSLAPLQSLCPNSLEQLFVACNKVTAITSISHLTKLTVLELGSNRVRKIEGLETLVELRELWLGRNRISKIEGLDTLTNLVKISLQSNRVESMAGLEACVSLRELYLSHNGIWRLEGLAGLTALEILDVSSNRISEVPVSELCGLAALQDLWLNDNQIPALDAALHAALAPLSASLTCIYLDGNPAAKDPQYKTKLLEWLPHLTQLDANMNLK